MRGVDVTNEQIQAADKFFADTLGIDSLARSYKIEHADLVKLLAWYGAILYRPAMHGTGEEDKPALPVPTEAPCLIRST